MFTAQQLIAISNQSLQNAFQRTFIYFSPDKDYPEEAVPLYRRRDRKKWGIFPIYDAYGAVKIHSNLESTYIPIMRPLFGPLGVECFQGVVSTGVPSRNRRAQFAEMVARRDGRTA